MPRTRLLSFLLTTCLLLPTPIMATAADGYGNAEIASMFPMKGTIERKGDMATMVVLFSYKRMKAGYVTNKSQPKAFYYNSSKATIAFDCKRKKSRIIGTVFFSDRSGLGNVVHEQDATGAWVDEHDRRPQESHFSIACEPPGGKKP